MPVRLSCSDRNGGGTHSVQHSVEREESVAGLVAIVQPTSHTRFRFTEFVLPGADDGVARQKRK